MVDELIAAHGDWLPEYNWYSINLDKGCMNELSEKG